MSYKKRLCAYKYSPKRQKVWSFYIGRATPLSLSWRCANFCRLTLVESKLRRTCWLFRRPAKKRSHETQIVDVGRATDEFVSAEKQTHIRPWLSFCQDERKGNECCESELFLGVHFCHNFEMAASASAVASKQPSSSESNKAARIAPFSTRHHHKNLSLLLSRSPWNAHFSEKESGRAGSRGVRSNS